jgi:hypothetical protein
VNAEALGAAPASLVRIPSLLETRVADNDVATAVERGRVVYKLRRRARPRLDPHACVVAIGVGCGLLASCGDDGRQGSGGEARDIVAGWSLEQQIGQLILYGVEVSNPRYVPGTGSTGAAVDEFVGLVEDYNLAGFTLEEGNRELFLDPSLSMVSDLDVGGCTRS